MNISDENSKNGKSSYPPGLRDISLESPQKGIPLLQSRIELPKEDPFSLKVIEGLEKQGLFIRWRFGYRLANRYEVRRIHSGGMGIVWIVEDLFDNRKPYAAKSVKPFFRKPETDEQWARRENSIQRFLEECKIWVDLEKHRHIVHAEFLEKIEGVPLVMSEYIEGGDLTAQIEKGPLPIETVLDYAIQFCIGMEYANGRGVIVHRDIKPGNIMVTTEEVLKVGDFGLTKAIRVAEEIRKEEAALYEESQSPLEGAIISVSRGFGTPPYMAPEQFNERLLEYAGHPIYPIDTACDIFAFGLVLYEMIKGKHAYWTDISTDRETWDNAHRIASSVSFHPAYVYYFLKSINLNLSKPISDNEQLDNLILKCLKKNPEERFKSFTELKKELLKIFPTLAKGGEGGFKYEIIEDPLPKPNYKNKGKTAFILGREEESIKFYDKALEENPGDTDVWLEKGLAMAEMGKLGEFGVYMEVVSYLKPSKEDVINGYKDVILKAKEFSRRDLKMLNDIALKYSAFQEINDYVSQQINEKYDETFKDLNPYLTRGLNELSDENAFVRQAAAWALGKLKDQSAIPYLIGALKDEHKHAFVRQAAAWALGELKDQSVIPHLIEALKDADASVRGEAAEVLGKLKDQSAIPYLIGALKDEKVEVRGRAAWALGELEDQSVIPHLIEALKDANGYICWSAAEALGKLKDPSATPHLIEALKGESASVRDGAARALGELKDQSAIPYLIGALKDEDASVRQAAAGALGELEDQSVIPHLIEALKDANGYICWNAAWALGELEDQSVIPHLIGALKDEDASVRMDAAEILGELKNPSAIPHLIGALKDEKVEVRGRAAEALGKLKDPSALPHLIEALKDKYPYVCELAAWALGKLKDQSAIPYLIGALKDEHKHAFVRQAAARALGELKDPSALPHLIEALKDKRPDVREWAAWALRYIWSKTEKDKAETLKHSLAPYSALAWNKKGIENLETGNKEEAIKCFEKAISIDPDWQEPKENLKRCKEG